MKKRYILPVLLKCVLTLSLTFSSCIIVDLPEETPNTPRGVSAAALSSSSIRVSWNSVPDAENYVVYYEVGLSSTKEFAAYVKGTSYIHSGLQAGTTYFYYITAMNSSGESNYSSYAAATTNSDYTPPTQSKPPSAPTGVAVEVLDINRILVTWNSVSGAASYDVYYSTGKSTTKNYAANVTWTSYTHTGLNENTSYFYYVTARNSNGESDFSGSALGYTSRSDTIPAPPANLAYTTQKNSTVLYIWDSVSNATSYEYQVLYRNADWSSIQYVTGASVTVDALVKGNQISVFRVRSRNASGESTWATKAYQ